MPILFVLPNSWSLYTLRISKHALDSDGGRPFTFLSTFRVGKARVVENDAGQDVFAIDLAPLSTKALFGNDTLASHTYGDIPQLDGSSFSTSSPWT